MHLGLDLLFWHSRAGGMARYTRELIPAMRRVQPDLRLTAYVSSELPEDVPALLGDDVHYVRFPVTVTHGPPWNAASHIWAHWAQLAWHAARTGVDVVHGPANLAPLWAGGVARVVTLHDLIWLRDRGASMGLRSTLAMCATALPSARMADRLITPSQTAKRDVCETLRIDPQRVDAILHGIAAAQEVDAAPEALLRERFGLGDAPVVLCVAQKRAHKNLDGLVRALALLADERAVLVLPGEPTAYEGRLRELAAQLGVGARVRFPDWLSDAEIEGLYALADVCCLPSREEGFGLPILEAMRRCTPVACSDRSAMPEAAGGAAELFDPDDPAAIANALDRLLGSPQRRRELVARGLERCAVLTWERSARLTLDSYGRAIERRRSAQ
jgi:glycosyltransferase involved in cell wall biosynthesis